MSCVVQAFRRFHSAEASNISRLYGLHLAATYTVLDWLDRSPPKRRTGAESMEVGLQVDLTERPSVAMLLIRLEFTQGTSMGVAI